MKKQLKFIDLFAGIGGFHVALKSLDMKCVFTSEIDRYARLTYSANFKDKYFTWWDENLLKISYKYAYDFILCILSHVL